MLRADRPDKLSAVQVWRLAVVSDPDHQLDAQGGPGAAAHGLPETESVICPLRCEGEAAGPPSPGGEICVLSRVPTPEKGAKGGKIHSSSHNHHPIASVTGFASEAASTATAAISSASGSIKRTASRAGKSAMMLASTTSPKDIIKAAEADDLKKLCKALKISKKVCVHVCESVHARAYVHDRIPKDTTNVTLCLVLIISGAASPCIALLGLSHSILSTFPAACVPNRMRSRARKCGASALGLPYSTRR